MFFPAAALTSCLDNEFTETVNISASVPIIANVNMSVISVVLILKAFVFVVFNFVAGN